MDLHGGGNDNYSLFQCSKFTCLAAAANGCNGWGSKSKLCHCPLPWLGVARVYGLHVHHIVESEVCLLQCSEERLP